MKTKPLRKKHGGQRSAETATKHIRKSRPRIIRISRRIPAEFSGGVDDEEALVVEESLDERERRG